MGRKKKGRIDTRKIVKKKIKQGLTIDEVSPHNIKERQEYALGAQLILESKVWQNETRRLVELWRNEIATKAEDFGQVLDLRMQISALLLLEDVFETIAAEVKTSGPEETAEDPFHPI